MLGVRVPQETAALLDAASEVFIGAGNLVDRLDPSFEPVLLIVIDGLMRIYSARGDRQVTVGYRTTGDLFGVAGIFAPSIRQGRIRISAEAMTDLHALKLPSKNLVDLASASLTVRSVIFDHFAEAVVEGYDLLTQSIFLPIRGRVARSMLDLAIRGEEGFVVSAHHQEIADSIGSVRQVVSRTITSLCDAGMIRRRASNGYVLTDPAGLHRLANAYE